MFLGSQFSSGFRFVDKSFDDKDFPEEARDIDEENEDVPGVKNISDDKIVNLAEKRFNKHLKNPCGCHFQEKTVDFGKDAFPRYHPTKVCDREKISASENHCTFNSQCMEHFTKVLLLKYKPTTGDQADSNDLPRGIRKDFYWDTKEISVDCRCTFK